jgi:hypothetical protein
MLGDNYDSLMTSPILVVPTLLAKPSYDPRPPAFLQVVQTAFRQFSPDLASNEQYLFHRFLVAILVIPVHRYRETCHGSTIHPYQNLFRVLYEISLK